MTARFVADLAVMLGCCVGGALLAVLSGLIFEYDRPIPSVVDGWLRQQGKS